MHQVRRGFGVVGLLVLTLAAGGTTHAASAAGSQDDETTTVLVLFDASHSMGTWLYTKPMIDIAKEGVTEVLDRLHRDTIVGLRVFAHEIEGDPCTTTALLVPFGAANGSELKAAVSGLEAEGTKTPLAYTLALAREELAPLTGKRRIVLLSDGNDTCQGDPVAEAAQLGEMGVPLDIVGIGAQRRIPQYQDMAAANGLGSYVQARNPQQFSDTMAGLFAPYSDDSGSPARETEDMGNPLLTEMEVDDQEAPAAAGAGGGAGDGAGSPPASPEMPAAPTEEPPDAPEEVQDPAITTVGADLEIILDVSNSMWGQIDGTAKIELAQRALGESLDELAGSAVVTAFRAYGHRVSREDREQGCLDTQLLRQFERGNLGDIRADATSMSPKGQTPIALSLEKAGEDLLSRPGYKHYLLLLSDGIESCDGDPVAVAQSLRDAGIDVVIHTVGFDVDAAAERQLRGVADATLGTYFDAGDYEALAAALREITAEVAEVAAMTEVNRERNPVMGGPTVAEAVPLAPGRYTLTDHLATKEYTHFSVALESGDLLTIATQVTTQVPVDRGEAIHNSHIRAYVFDAKGERIRGVDAIAIGEPGSRDTGRYVATAPVVLVVAIGADFNPVHMDSLFEIGVTRRFDAGSGRDMAADDDFGIGAGTVSGSLGLQDKVDRYRLDGTLAEGTVWSVLTEPSIDDARLQVAIVDGEGRRLARAISRGGSNELEVTLPAGLTAIYVELTDRTVSTPGQLYGYRLTITTR
jgi:Ca-activated chloride channel family protein